MILVRISSIGYRSGQLVASKDWRDKLRVSFTSFLRSLRHDWSKLKIAEIRFQFFQAFDELGDEIRVGIITTGQFPQKAKDVTSRIGKFVLLQCKGVNVRCQLSVGNPQYYLWSSVGDEEQARLSQMDSVLRVVQSGLPQESAEGSSKVISDLVCGCVVGDDSIASLREQGLVVSVSCDQQLRTRLSSLLTHGEVVYVSYDPGPGSVSYVMCWTLS